MQSVPNVSPYFQSCQDFVTTTSIYFPTNYSLPDDVFIPYWASTDPNTWPAQHFDVATAKDIWQEGHADINKATASSVKKKTPIRAIIGSVVGGLGLLVLTTGAVLYRRQPSIRQVGSPSVTLEHLTHIQAPFDMTMELPSPFGFATIPEECIIEPFTSRPINIPLRATGKHAAEPLPMNDTRTKPIINILSREPRRPPSNPPDYNDTNHFPSWPPREQRPYLYQKYTSGAIRNGTGHARGSRAYPVGYVAKIPEIPAPVVGHFGGGPNGGASRPRSQGNANPGDLA